MEYRIEELDSKTWLIEEFDANTSVYMYLLEDTEKAVLIDTGIGTLPLDAIVKKLTDRPTVVINTHGHFDHTGGNSLFKDVYMNENDRDVYKLHCEEYGNFSRSVHIVRLRKISTGFRGSRVSVWGTET